jgi:hypothetical protein
VPQNCKKYRFIEYLNVDVVDDDDNNNNAVA